MIVEQAFLNSPDSCNQCRPTVVWFLGQVDCVCPFLKIHQDPDDFGKGGFSDSLTTGHAGSRIGCCVISAACDVRTSVALVLLCLLAAVYKW